VLGRQHGRADCSLGCLVRPVAAPRRMTMHSHETWRYALVIPVLAMLLVTFVVPLLEVVRTSVADDELQASLPNVAAALRPWDGQSTVPAEARQALLLDLPAAPPQKLAAL